MKFGLMIKKGGLVSVLIMKDIWNQDGKLDKIGLEYENKMEKKLYEKVAAIAFLFVTSLLINWSYSFEIQVNFDLVFF